MIAHLRGAVAAKHGSALVVDVHGVGYRVHVTDAAAQMAEVGEQVFLYTVQVVREDDLTLYGFASDDERMVFEMLTSVSGVGPRLALSCISTLSAARVVSGLASGDARMLVATPGIGMRIAERMVLELRERAAEMSLVSRASGGDTTRLSADDATAALVALGYTRADAARAVESCRRDTPDAEPAELIRAALQLLTRKA